MNISKSIKIALIQRGWTQVELADKLNITTAAMSNIANERTCSGSRLITLAETFDMPVSELVALGEFNGGP